MPVPRSILTSRLVDLDLQLVRGTWPEGIGGEVFLATSDQATAPRHGFFGDGWVLRLSLEPGRHGAPPDRFAWRGHIIDTPSRRLRERHPEQFHATAFGTRSPFGSVNSANTAPLPWGDRLFATWDAGRPVEVDPDTLGFLGEVGDRASWGPDPFDHPVLPLYPSSAHPCIDPERGCLWSVVYDPVGGRVDVVRWDGASTAVQRWPLDGASLPQSMHTVGQTREWLVLVDCAFRVDPDELLELGERSVTTFTDEPCFLVRKDQLEATPPGAPVPVRAVRLAPETNHYSARWDDADGIHLLLEHTVDTDLAMHLRADDLDAWGRPVDPALRGLYNHPMHHGVVTEVHIDPARGTVTREAIYEQPEVAYATQLSALDWSIEGITAPEVHHMLFTGFRPDAITQRALALYRDRVRSLPDGEIPPHLVTLGRGGLQPKGSHTFAVDDYPTSPCFVPSGAGRGDGRSRYAPSRPGGQHGWIVVPVLHDGGFRVEVFDAADVGGGAVAILAAPASATVPFLIHSAWMPAAVPADRSLPRLRFCDDLDPARVDALAPELARSVWAVADELG